MKTTQEILKTLQAMDEAYASGNKSWFDFFADNVTVYTNTSAEPIIGKDNYVRNFAKLLGSTKRKIDVLSRQVQSVGDVHIVYQVVQVTQDGIVVNMKESQVWGDTKDGLKLYHLHSSLLGTPHATSVATKASSINVLNEKIATIATAVGMAQ
jgi:hypothetical protein